MKQLYVGVCLLTLILFANQYALAAKPVSVKQRGQDTNDEGEYYVVFQVKCSNGIEKSISAFNKKKLWCKGKGLKENCNKKQIKAAKLACKNS